MLKIYIMSPTDTIGITEFMILVYKFCKRNFLLIIGFTILGGALGFTYNKLKPEYYNSEMLGYSELATKSTVLEVLAPLTLFAEEKNYDQLANTLGLSVEEASQIRSIEFLDSKHTKTSNNPSSSNRGIGNLILTSVMVYDQNILPKVETGLVNYIENNPYLLEKKQMELTSTQVLIQEITERLETLDSLNMISMQALNTSPQEASQLVNVTTEQSPVGFIESLKYVEYLRNRLTTLTGYTVVNSFYTVSKPSNKNIIILTGLTIAFLIVGVILSLIREVVRIAQKE